MLALSGNSHGSCGPHSLPLQRNNISELAATLVLSKFSYHKFSLSSKLHVEVVSFKNSCDAPHIQSFFYNIHFVFGITNITHFTACFSTQLATFAHKNCNGGSCLQIALETRYKNRHCGNTM
jgi:hypothetical protein